MQQMRSVTDLSEAIVHQNRRRRDIAIQRRTGVGFAFSGRAAAAATAAAAAVAAAATQDIAVNILASSDPLNRRTPSRSQR
jgi:hypothetical protein